MGGDAGEDQRRWAEAWAASGAMALTGFPDAAPQLAPPALMSTIDHLGRRIEGASAALGRRVALDWPALLGERAAIADLRRHGDRSCGGSCRLLPAADGWLAVSLPRADDVELLPAWLLDDVDPTDPWPHVARIVRAGSGAALAARAALLGLPVAELGETDRRDPPVAQHRLAAGRAASSLGDCLVVDLSSLWAGPLCAHLLGLAGARVVKVESLRRPDGARRGPTAFFDLLHGGHENVALELTQPDGRAALQALVRRADVVIEASRPRALRQLGVDAHRLVAAGRCRAWVSLTGHGRDGAAGQRSAFGDDAAVAGGLVARDPDRGWCFCADAIADPLAGIAATAAVLEVLRGGGRWLLDVALARCAAACAGAPAPRLPRIEVSEVAPPRARPPVAAAPSLGTHTAAVLTELGVGPG
jgi:crotonobetainyl-CoA:carnitine CoA-transferase CaiB-like acyl-CoA transferase